MGDSLASIALKHNMSRGELMRLNGLLGERVSPGQVLRVVNPSKRPETAEEALNRQRRTVRRLTGCVMEEAMYYLDQAGGDVAGAVAMHQADAAWEEATSGALTARAASFSSFRNLRMLCTSSSVRARLPFLLAARFFRRSRSPSLSESLSAWKPSSRPKSYPSRVEEFHAGRRRF